MNNRFYDVVCDYYKNFKKYNNRGLARLEYGLESKKNILKHLKQNNYPFENKSKFDKLLNIDVTQLIKLSIPNSFALKINFKLKTPYYSRDDDEFYVISNPCLKEKVFKVPMIRGSAWKGALLKASRDVIEDEKNNSIKIEFLKSYFRIFGVGDDSFRNIVDKIDDNSFKLFFMINGLAINVNSDVKEIFNKYKESKAQKGRAIFYPTFFEKLSLEVINPHNRKTKAGTNPIYYEVVPKNEKGILQIAYIPFDGVMEKDSKVREQAKQDLEFLKEAIKRVSKNGIGAKTKLGWGQFDIFDEIEPIWSER